MGKISYRPLRIWLAIIVGSLVFSGAFLSLDSITGITGLAIYDTPSPEMNPDLADEDEYMSNLSKAALIIALIIIGQIGVYIYTTKRYQKKDEQEMSSM